MSTFDYMSRLLERSSRRRINFKDQTINQELARTSSITGEYCTLDLKDASDLISYPIVMKLLEHHPALRWFFLNCRTTNVDLDPSGPNFRKNIHGLRKVAGMGSGLTFWVLAALSWTAVVASVRFHNPFMSPSYIRKHVFVYGDDVICRNEWFDYAAKGLTSLGLKLNKQKSFKGQSHTIFRESCGVNCVNGVDVTPVRLRLTGNKLRLNRDWTIERALRSSDDLVLLQLERHCRQLVLSGLRKTSELYYSIIEAHMRRRFRRKDYLLPRAGHNFPGLCRWTYMSNHFDIKSNPTENGNYPTINAFVPVAVTAKVHSTQQVEYSRKLYEISRRDYSPLDFLSEGSVGLVPGEISVQRRVRFAWNAISTISCDATLVDT
jgi:hypothetical protein